MKKLSTLLFCLMIILSSCSQKPKTLEDYNWLIGSWHTLMDGGQVEFIETWQKETDTKYTGGGFIIKNSDATLLEELSLEINNDTLYYTVVLDEGRRTAKFKGLAADNNSFEVSLPENDFPSTIKYNNKPDGGFTVTLIGTSDEGKEIKEVMEFSEKKQ